MHGNDVGTFDIFGNEVGTFDIRGNDVAHLIYGVMTSTFMKWQGILSIP